MPPRRYDMTARHGIRARRDYRDRRTGEIVRVTGWEWMPRYRSLHAEDGEWWARIRFNGERRSTMLCHPSQLAEV